jgi:uncharacterized membrane protein YfcA
VTILLGLVLGLVVGGVLGLIGAGGAILAVPGLVAVLGLSATAATTSSTIIVGSAALAAAIRRYKSGAINIKIGLTFSALGFLGTFLGTYILQFLAENVVLVIFALLMFGSAFAMCCRELRLTTSGDANWFAVAIAATTVGVLTGLLGIGGGFLIVPALVLFLKIPTNIAAGTSLVAISVNSLLAFSLRYQYWNQIPLLEIAVLTAVAIVASVAVSPFSTKANPKLLQRGFAVVISLVASYLLATNLG